MPQLQFENYHIHPRVATMIHNMGWLFLHEYRCEDWRIDFVALNPDNGDLAIVECKTHITNPIPVMAQIGAYHYDFQIWEAFKWVFVWDKPSNDIVEAMAEDSIKVFHVEESVLLTSPQLKNHQKYAFYRAFYHFYPCHNYFPFVEPNGTPIHHSYRASLHRL